MALPDLYSSIDNKWLSIGTASISSSPLLTVNGGREEAVADACIELKQKGFWDWEILLVTGTGAMKNEQTFKIKMSNVCSRLRALIVADTYSQAVRETLINGKKEFASWRKWYGFKANSDVIFTRVNALGVEKQVPLKIDSMPCHYCGIRYPLSIIEIDHHHPKSESGGLAVNKVWRVLGFSVDNTMKGAKGNSLSASPSLQNSNATFQFYPKEYSLNREIFPTKVSFSKNRYKMTTEGAIVYTILKKALTSFPEYCVNSVVNLTPICRNCNGRKGTNYF